MHALFFVFVFCSSGSQVQDDIEAVKIQLMELRKEMDENKGAIIAIYIKPTF